jgi:hypothetical protein
MPITAAIAKLFFFQGNTQVTTLAGLQDDETGLFISGASLQMTLVDDDGNKVVGCIQVPMTYVATTNGNYQGTFGNNTFYPSIGTSYTLLIDGSYLGSYIHLEVPVEVQARKF